MPSGFNPPARHKEGGGLVRGLQANLRKLRTWLDSHPHGVLGYAEITSNFSIGSELSGADITGLSVTVNIGTSRRIRVTGNVQVHNASAGGDRCIVHIQDSADNQLQRVVEFENDANLKRAKFEGSVILEPSAGEETYNLFFQNVNGGAWTVEAGTVYPSFILVEDLGAV